MYICRISKIFLIVMINIGKYNKLRIKRAVDFGLYLGDEEGNEVLIPSKYVDFDNTPGSEVEVFVYLDSEQRPIATTLKPKAQVGEFAFLKVAQVNDTGAFLEWGIPKEILVPFREQRVKMVEGRVYPVYIYLDDASGRIVASAKLGKFLGNVYPDFKYGDKVSVLVYQEIAIGYKVVVNNLHPGIIYKNQIYEPLSIGDRLTAYIQQVRPDGRLDISVKPSVIWRTDDLKHKILDYINRADAQKIGDKTDSEIIHSIFKCSKKDFKRAVGALYRERLIIIEDGLVFPAQD